MTIENMKATTVVALAYAEGVLIAADQQATMMPTMDRFHEPIQKLVEVSPHSVAGIAGAPAVLVVAEHVRVQWRIWNRQYGRALSPEGQFSVLKMLFEQWSRANPMMPSAIIFVAFDVEEKRSRIFSHTFGMPHEYSTGFASIGSGASHVLAFLTQHAYQPTVSFAAALDFLRRAMRASTQGNTAVGSVYGARQITASGIRDVSSELHAEVSS